MDMEEALMASGLWLPTCPGLPSQMSSYWLDAVSWTADQSPWLGGPALCQFDLELSDIFPCCCIPRVQRALVSQSSYLGAAWLGLWAPGQLSIVLAREATGWTAHVR